MFRRIAKEIELPENVVSFLRDYNKVYILDSGKEANSQVDQMVDDIINGVIEDYISPVKRCQNCLSGRGILIQIFCKEHTFGVFSYYWEDSSYFFGKFKKKNFIAMNVNTKKLMKIKVARDILINERAFDLKKEMEIFQEFYFIF